MKKLLTAALLFAFISFAPIAVAEVIIDDSDGAPGYTRTGFGNFRTEAQHGGSYLGTGSRFSNTTGDVATYTPNISVAGLYSIEIWYPNTDPWASDARIAVNHANGTTDTRFNQRGGGNFASLELGGSWNSIGTFHLDAGTGNSVVYTRVSGNVNTDAVRFVQLGGSATPTPIVLDNTGGGETPGAGLYGYSETGSWNTSSNQGNLYSAGVNDRVSDTIGSTATWQAHLGLGFYTVELTWQEFSNRADNALFEVVTAGGGIEQFRVDQTQAPVGATGSGVTWFELGTFLLDEGSFIRTTVDADAGGFVVADGVRITFNALIPEPTSAALLGLAGLALLRRRRPAQA